MCADYRPLFLHQIHYLLKSAAAEHCLHGLRLNQI
jgi:hypothetical protein